MEISGRQPLVPLVIERTGRKPLIIERAHGYDAATRVINGNGEGLWPSGEGARQ